MELEHYFGDVPVVLEYNVEHACKLNGWVTTVDLLAVYVGDVDIISGLSKEDLESYECDCAQHAIYGIQYRRAA